MSEYRNVSVSVKGDGNAVGDNNRITVNKKEEHHYGGRPRVEDGSAILGAGILALVAVAAICYHFSRHANAIYLTLEVVGGFESLAAMVATTIYVNRSAYAMAGKTSATMACAAGVAFVSLWASGNYNPDIMALAKEAGTFKAFWCGLNVDGRHMAMLHTLVDGVFLVFAAVLLLGPTLIPPYIAAAGMEVSSAVNKTVVRLTSWKVIGVAAALMLVAAYAHSGAGWKAWSEATQTTFAWPLCVR